MALIFFFVFVVLAVAFYAHRIEPRRLEVSRHSVDMRDGDPGEGRVRIVLVSDIHFHDRTRLPGGWIERINELDADLIVLAGDLIDDDSGIESCGGVFARLRARHGVFAVLGNHDHRHYKLDDFLRARRVPITRNDVSRLVDRLRAAGVDVMRNERREFEIDGVRVDLVGFDDAVTGEYDRERTFAGFAPPVDHGMRIFLTHWGGPAHRETSDPRTLGLSGHTHGGQIWIPFFSRAVLSRRLQSGQFRGWFGLPGGGRLYIGRGMGFARLAPFRLNASPEVAVFDVCATRAGDVGGASQPGRAQTAGLHP